MTLTPDIEAAMRLTGQSAHAYGVHDDCSAYTCGFRRTDKLTGAAWTVVSESDATKTYTVTVRAAIKGGRDTYVHCTCPIWGIRFNAGQDCKHIAGLRTRGMLP